MEMRSGVNIEGLGLDLTPQLPPLAYSLSDPYLHSHCSSCFHPLPSSSSPNPSLICYCSPSCSNQDSQLHLTSREHHLFLTLQSHPTTRHSTTDLRVALRLLHRFTQLNLLPSHSDRIGGLLTNHEKLKQQDEVYAKIREGARLMSRARRLRDIDEDENDDFVEEEMVLCIVLTNAVEVQIGEQHGLGVAVYGPEFSWINHSCSPNACYRFAISGTESSESRMRISPSGSGDELVQMISNQNGFGGNGPRIVVRSIKTIKKGEEVCVAYTNLLQPKAARNLELWVRHAFICFCRRCSASPTPYVDRVLHAKCAAKYELANSSWDHSFCEDDAYDELSDLMDDIISEYLSTGNSECCCDKLETMLVQNTRNEQLQPAEWPTFKLHPLCHLSLNAYITLASAYKVRASELVSDPTITNSSRLEAFELTQTSAAYSLLLAGATNHLFLSERSLIVSAVHFWISAGESLLILARSTKWDSISTEGFLDLKVPSVPTDSNGKSPFTSHLEVNMGSKGSECISTEVEFEVISKSFADCASKLSSRVWHILSRGKKYLKYIKDPIDFGWLETTDAALGVSHASVSNISINTHCSDGGSFGVRHETENTNQERSVFQLGVHGLLYGAYLASICYGRPCYLTAYVNDLLELKE